MEVFLMTRHLVSRSQQLIVLLALLLALATAVIILTQHDHITASTPAPVQLADGWGDPTGG